MLITLRLPHFLESLLEKMERQKIRIFLTLVLGLASQIFVASYAYHLTPLATWLWLGLAILLLVALGWRLSLRNSLVWQANALLSTLKESPAIDLARLGKEMVSFQTAGSMFRLWILLAIIVCPYFGDWLNVGPLGYWSRVYGQWDTEFLSALWQIHATILGLFVALLAIVFQMMSVKLAYESSLLPFLAKRIRFARIVSANFLFLALDAIAIRQDSAELPSGWKYFVVLGFLFSVVSAIFLTYRTLDLLAPEALQAGLRDMIRANIAEQLETEQREALAEYVLAQECEKYGMQFTVWDFHNQLAAIRANGEGEVVDVRLDRLRKFAKNLKHTVPLQATPQHKAILVRGIGHRLEAGRTVLARVHSADNTLENNKRLNRCFRLSG